jgi:hypothetical protein
MTSNKHNANLKAKQKGCWEKNGCVISLKCSVEADVHPFLLPIQRGITQCHHCTRISSHDNLKWVWNESEPELLALIAFNKNGQKYTKNLKPIKRATKAQLPRQPTSIIALEEMKPTPPKEMGRKI